MTVTGKSVGENLKRNINVDRSVIKTFSEKLADTAGFLVMKGNFFSSAIMKTSVISKEFTKRYLSNPKHPNVFYVKAAVFEGPEDYHKRINNKNLFNVLSSGFSFSTCISCIYFFLEFIV